MDNNMNSNDQIGYGQNPYQQGNPYENQSGPLSNTQNLYGQANNMSGGQEYNGMNYNMPNQGFQNNVVPGQSTYNQYANYGATPPPNPKNSGLGVAALILSILACTSFIGLILAIVDLCKKDGKKKTLSVVAICISGVWLFIFLLAMVFSDKSDKSGDSASVSDTVVDNSTGNTDIESSDNVVESGSDDNSVEADQTDSTKNSSDSDEYKSETSENDAQSEEDFKSSCEVTDYDSIARNPSDYKGKSVKIEGTVIQVQESEAFFSDDVDVTLRVAENGSHDKIWYITYKRTDTNEGRILEDDYITIFGICDGIKSYTAVLGNEVTIPTAEAKYIVNGKVDETGSVSTFDAQAIADSLNIVEYNSEDSFSKHYYMVIENTSDFDLDIDVSVNYYDESEKLIGTDSNSENAIAVGNKGVFFFWPDDNTSTVQYKISVSMSEFYKPVQDDVTYEISETEDKIVVTAKNISDDTIDSIEGKALFFKDGIVVGSDSAYFTDSDYELKAGDEVTKELSCYGGYDSYEFYIYPKKSSY